MHGVPVVETMNYMINSVSIAFSVALVAIILKYSMYMFMQSLQTTLIMPTLDRHSSCGIDGSTSI